MKDNDSIIRDLLGGIGEGGDDDTGNTDFDVTSALRRVAVEQQRRKGKPLRTISTTERVSKMGKEGIELSKKLAEEAKPHLDALKAILKKAQRQHNKFWSLVEVEMDLGNPMDLTYNPDTDEIEVYSETGEDEE